MIGTQTVPGTVTLDGHQLTIEQVAAVARYGAKTELSPSTWPAIDRAAALVDDIVKTGRRVYGISTGFGEFSKVAIGKEKSATLQENLILSHCVAVGEPLGEETVRAMMLLRVNALCKGYSGIRRAVIETLVSMLNAGVHPIVPQQGSLGASGDLAPLSHMALVLLGRGEAVYQGSRMPGAEAMRRAGIPTVHLIAKEGLALINGTQCMTAIAALCWYDADALARLCDVTASMTMCALESLTSACDARIQNVRPHQGQALVAGNIRLLTAGSGIASMPPKRVQDAYTIRCIPQVHGAVRDALAYARGVIETELNAVTDNPILFPDDGDVISGGNFHGEPLALVCDFLGIAVSELGNISERRLERLVNPQLSCGLPAFLTPDGGLNSGYMICQYSAASLASENKVLAHPASVDSIPSSANQEDHVSMGTTAARKLRSIVENVTSILAFELMAAVQGIDLRQAPLSPAQRAVYALVRETVAPLEGDRELREDITGMNALVRSGSIDRAVRGILPELK